MTIMLVVFLLVALAVIKPPKIKIPERFRQFEIDFSIAPLLGVIFLLITQTIPLSSISEGIVGNEQIQPWAIIILFFSLAYICISLDSSGVYNYLALKAVVATKGSGIKLFFAFFLLSSVFTIITSNDIVILTLTPIIAYFTSYTKTDPIPFLIGQFFASNIWSISLLIGNPTNIIVGLAYDISFITYSAWMLIPAATSGFVCMALVFIVFKKRIPEKIDMPTVDPAACLKDKFGAIYGLICLFACLLLLAVSQWTSIPVWAVTLAFGLMMFARDVIVDARKIINQHSEYTLHNTDGHDLQDVSKLETAQEAKYIENNPQSDMFSTEKTATITWKTGLTAKTLSRLPWKIIPFVIGMFILVAALHNTGWIGMFATALSTLMVNRVAAVFIMCFLSSFTCNVLNNQPMTILFTRILLHSDFIVSPDIKQACIYALIMGSNYGANFTLIGALAGIMWKSILINKNIKISYLTFAKYGFLIMPLVVAAGCSMYVIELMIMG